MEFISEGKLLSVTVGYTFLKSTGNGSGEGDSVCSDDDEVVMGVEVGEDLLQLKRHSSQILGQFQEDRWIDGHPKETCR